MPRRKASEEEVDVVERVQMLDRPDPLHRELVEHVVYLREQMAHVTRDLNRCRQERLLALNHKLRTD